MSDRLYNRFLQLSLIRPIVQTVRTPEGFWARQPNAITIRAMRVQFKIEKHIGNHPNKASITVTNLAPETRAAFSKVPLIVQLDAGYDGQLQRVFAGDLRVGDTIHKGPDVETTLEMGDGDTAYQFGHLSKSYSSGSKMIETVKDALGALGLPPPPGIDQIQELQGAFAGGATFHGPAQKALTTVMTRVGMSWSIQDGKAVLLRDGEVRPGQAVVISEKTGMIGSPKLSAPKKPGEALKLHVRKVLDARIVAGGTVSVESQDVNGLFRVEHLEHVGDYRGKEWYTNVIGRKL